MVAETMSRRRPSDDGRVAGNNFQSDSLSPALAGHRQILGQSRIGVAVGMPFVCDVKIVPHVVRMAKQ
jgi:hypothetical protein